MCDLDRWNGIDSYQGASSVLLPSWMWLFAAGLQLLMFQNLSFRRGYEFLFKPRAKIASP
jgi:hypothetical protein